MNQYSSLKGILFDLDGVLYIGDHALEGAVEAVQRIRSSHITCRFVTNTSTLSIASLTDKINQLGFDIPSKEIISAPQAALRYLQKKGAPVCRLLLSEDVKQDFATLPHSETEAEYIVIGDIGDTWSYQMMNEAFNCLIHGAKLIAIHKNRFWQTEQGLQMDIGGFVHALEYASNTKALMMGKPSIDFFKVALDDMHLNASQVAMIGDDIDSDIGGAQQAGIKGILVRTGKYRPNYVDASPVRPDMVIESIKHLPKLLGL